MKKISFLATLAIVVAVSFSTFSPAWAVEDDYADEAFRQAVAYQASSAVDAAILKTGPAYGLSNPGEYQKKGLRKVTLGQTETTEDWHTVSLTDLDRIVSEHVGANANNVKFLILITANDGQVGYVSGSADLHETFKNITAAHSSNESVGEFYEIGPDVYQETGHQLGHFLRTVFVRIGFNLAYVCEDQLLFKTATLDDKIQEAVEAGYNVKIYYILSGSDGTTPIEDDDPTDPEDPIADSEPVFKTKELSDEPWPATYDWSGLADGQYAAQIKKNSNGSVSGWKLVQRNGDQIETQYKNYLTFAPANSQEIKDQFLENPETATGDFVFYGEYSDKIIWVWED